jgi:restriction endonuclease S subunit
MKDGWQTKRLADFSVTVSTGPFGSILHKSDYVDDGVPLVNPINIVGESIVPDPSKLISDATKRRLTNYVLNEGDVVVGRRGEIGRCATVGPNENGWVCGTGSFFIRPLQTLHPQFLAHLIRSNGYREKLEQLSTGTTMKNLSNTSLGDLAISVPPFPEQQRIVAILEEAFEGIATAKANAEKNLHNARALFESHLQSVFTERSNGWEEKSVGELVAEGILVKPFDGNHGEIHPRKSDYTDSGVPFIMACDLQNGSVDTEYCKFISQKLADSLRVGFAKDGDVLISHKGTIGRSAIVSTEDDYVMLTPQVTSYRVKNANRLFNRFIRYYFMSPVFQAEMIAGAADGSTRAYIKLTSGKTPRDSRFSLPLYRYFNRHHLPPDGETSRYRPRSSNNLRGFLADLTFRIEVLVRLIWGQLPFTWTSVPPMLPPDVNKSN